MTRPGPKPMMKGTGEGARRVRRVRSTRRRADAVDLPRMPVEERSVGRTFTAPDGTTYRPSMFVTLTLGSYGKVVAGKPGRVVAGAGCPVDDGRYDYRRAALEAMFFTRLFDRWVQNLRRCAGFRVQYFGAIEPQRRLAPHIHLAIRGAIPRRVLRAVTESTYLQLWWPAFDTPVYRDEPPRWDRQDRTYRDPDSGVALPTWEEALDVLDEDPDAEPAVVMHFGRQVDIKGIIASSEDANTSVRYLTKYLTKAVAETYADRIARPMPTRRTSTGCMPNSASCRAAPSAPTGCATGCSPRTLDRVSGPAGADRRRTTVSSSAWAAAGCRCRGTGPARR